MLLCGVLVSSAVLKIFQPHERTWHAKNSRTVVALNLSNIRTLSLLSETVGCSSIRETPQTAPQWFGGDSNMVSCHSYSRVLFSESLVAASASITRMRRVIVSVLQVSRMRLRRGFEPQATEQVPACFLALHPQPGTLSDCSPRRLPCPLSLRSRGARPHGNAKRAFRSGRRSDRLAAETRRTFSQPCSP